MADIFIYPTDTAYAIGCLFNDRSSIQKIMKMKGRTDSKFTIIASSLHQVEKYFKLNACQKKLAKKYWPGPLSIVVSKRFAVRVPDNEIARRLARKIGKPIIATSFNKSGKPEVYDLDRVHFHIDEVLVINTGRLPKRKPSTIVECRKNNLIIHRFGSVAVRPQPPTPSPLRRRGGTRTKRAGGDEVE